MKMSRARLRALAEYGARERLREIQRELVVLRAEFPDLVQNADGSMPSVLPIVLKKKKAAKAEAAHNRRQFPVEERRQQAVAYLAAHPGASTGDIAAALNMTLSTKMRDHILRPIATSIGRGNRSGWMLKKQGAARVLSGNGNGHRASARTKEKKTKIPSGPKLLHQRQASADILDQFDRTTPRSIASNKLGVLVRRGYLAKKDDGYIRTAKPFHVNPNSAAAH